MGADNWLTSVKVDLVHFKPGVIEMVFRKHTWWTFDPKDIVCCQIGHVHYKPRVTFYIMCATFAEQ
jgi:hypothetical protein